LENFKITEEKLFMTVTQTKHSSNSIASALKTNGFKQLLAVGSIAMGVTATISAAPAGAANLAGGSINVTGYTTDFFFPLVGVGSNPSTFSLTFNKLLSSGADTLTNVGSSNGNLGTAIPPGDYSSSSQTIVFNQTLTNPLNYRIQSAAVFNFNGVTFTLPTLSRFGVSYNTDLLDNITGINLTLNQDSGSNFSDGTTSVPTSSLSFGISDDTASGNGGAYTIQASTKAVPEPFTIIGTIVGGTAAFRMRKKLAAANK
jgi:hypothetical protein